jgi:hypothetical protein
VSVCGSKNRRVQSKFQTGQLDIKNRLANWPSSKTPDWPTGYQTKFQSGKSDIKKQTCQLAIKQNPRPANWISNKIPGWPIGYQTGFSIRNNFSL